MNRTAQLARLRKTYDDRVAAVREANSAELPDSKWDAMGVVDSIEASPRGQSG
ncbi:hypothetical protein [Streptomyces sp. NPDC088358]|uniref:hypothetical protein n=1 Tax=Streptomyces sp. NPDC088358 TaxID=3365857 RepID=UPI003813866E